MVKHVWIDCDVGSDDAFALLLALFRMDIVVLGISTTYGNSSLDNCTSNTLRILNAFGDVNTQTYKGVSKPFQRPLRPVPAHIHGVSGLAGAGDNLPPLGDRTVEPLHAIFAMAQMIHSMPDDSVYLVITGPLTNVAMLLTLYPDTIPTKLKQVVIMGGAIGLGNSTPTSEMNIISDPESAEVVLAHPNLVGKFVLIPLETTHKAIANKHIQDEILGTEPSRLRRLMHGLLTAYSDAYAKVYGMTDGPPVHDPLTIFYVLHPEAFKTVFVHVTVQHGGKSDGMTICDMHKRTDALPNVHVSMDVDVDSFWISMLKAIEDADLKRSVTPSVQMRIILLRDRREQIARKGRGIEERW